MEENEYEQKMQRRVFNKFFPVFISNLLRNGLLDKSRLNDKDYIYHVALENLDIVDDLRIQVIDYHVFIEGLKSEISHSRYKTAIVLGGTCIEHIMNYFYQDLLSSVLGLEQSEINKAISMIKLPDKIGWFYKVTTKSNLPDKLVERILEIVSIRNKIVHYQAVPAIGELRTGSHMKLNDIINAFDVASISDTINKLESELNIITNNLWPEIDEAIEVFERLFK